MALYDLNAAYYNVVNELQIWMHADQRKSGFLDRTEFYNALRLATVAQSKRDLTPDIVKAALYGPAAAKIPAPQIHLPVSPVLQSNSMAMTSAPQMGLAAPAASQNFGYRGPGTPNAGVNQNYFPQQNQSVRPPQTMPTGTASRPPLAMPTVTASYPSQAMFSGTGPHPSQAMPTVTASLPSQAMPTGTGSHPPQGMSGGVMTSNFLGSNTSNDWFSGKTGAPPSGSIGVNTSIPSSAPKPEATVSTTTPSTVNESNALTATGDGFTSTSVSGSDLFSTKPSPPKEPSKPTYSTSGASASSATVPVSGGPQPSSKSMSLDSVLNGFSVQPTGSQLQRPQSPLNPSQQVSALGSSSFVSSGISSVGTGSSTSASSQPSWPKMKPADVQKYTKVFMEVDTDRDGKITGEQARNLFLSWRLPRGELSCTWMFVLLFYVYNL